MPDLAIIVTKLADAKAAEERVEYKALLAELDEQNREDDEDE